MTIQRLYSINANAADAEVSQLIALIQGDFGIEDGVDPADVADTSGTPTTATVDAAGLPHNKAIHSDVPTLTDKGMWRSRRGADKTAVSKYQAEHAAIIAAKTPAAAAASTPSLPSLPPLGGNTSLPPLPGANVRTAYHELADFLVANTVPVGRLNNEWLAVFWQQNNLTGLADLANNPERAGELLTALKGLLGQ